MPLYLCHAIDASGNQVRRQVEADNALEAKDRLLSQSLTVYQVDLVGQPNDHFRLTLSAAKKALLVRQLATFLGAGYTLEEALKSCARQSQDKKTASLSRAIHQRLVEGIPFYQVLRQYPKLFDETFTATIEAGEASGFLAAVLERLADLTESTQQLRSQMLQALIYPFILLLVSLFLVGYLMLAVVPEVVNVFSKSGQALPWLTEVLLQLSGFFTQHYIAVAVILLLIYLVIKWLARKGKNLYRWHVFLLRFPVSSALTKDYQTANYALTLSVLLQSGVKLIDALRISAQTLSNLALKQQAVAATESVLKGQSLAQSLMSEKHVFSGLLIELISSGERTGTLTQMLEKAGTLLLQQSQSRVKTLTALLGPLMILLMGLVIFMIVLAILLPIFDLNQLII